MEVKLCFHEVPKPHLYDGFLSLKSAENSMQSNAPVARDFAQGETFVTSSKLNRNATQLDLTARYGGGSIGVAYGLNLTIIDSLKVKMDPGHAVICGIVEVPEPITIELESKKGRTFFWLQQDGKIAVFKNHKEKPEIPACFVGSCLVENKQVKEVDRSGVFYLVSGIATTETADPSEPKNFNLNLSFVHQTQSGKYFYSKGAYCKFLPAGTPHWKKVAFTAKELQSKEKAFSIQIPGVPESAFIHAFKLKVFKPFKGKQVQEITLNLSDKNLKAIHLNKEKTHTSFSGFEISKGKLGEIHSTEALDQIKEGKADVWVLSSFISESS